MLLYAVRVISFVEALGYLSPLFSILLFSFIFLSTLLEKLVCVEHLCSVYDEVILAYLSCLLYTELGCSAFVMSRFSSLDGTCIHVN